MSPTGSARVFPNGRRRIDVIGAASDWRGERQEQWNEGITLFVDGLDARANYRQVRRMFEKFGKVECVFIQKERRARRKFRFGFVRFGTREEGIRAIQGLNRKKLNSAFITVHTARFPLRYGEERKQAQPRSKQGRPRKQAWRRKEQIVGGLGKKNNTSRMEWRVKRKESAESQENHMETGENAEEFKPT
ncbi:uncharacterized protein LOC130736434 [Lotus japonicus]|uniref:uncharacterized protein LOC130736434 n=1 Tax=Lotus japonicus TaxID=34305 RepID=UPI002586881C|nr:uncharacterized protein LOC130736434 [Lotus japonicus]